MRSLPSRLRAATLAALSTLSLAVAGLGMAPVESATAAESVSDSAQSEGTELEDSSPTEQEETGQEEIEEEAEPAPTKAPSKAVASPQAFAARSSDRPQDDPVNPSGVATGLPVLTSTWDPDGTVESGVTRTFTVKYANTSGVSSNKISDVRAWHQIMVEADHTTTYTVTCQADGNNSKCPTNADYDQPVFDVEQTIQGDAGVYYNTFWGIIDVGGKPSGGGSVTFTITMTTVLEGGEDACTAVQTVPVSGWARASKTGFAVPDDVGAPVRNAGHIIAPSNPDCPDGDVRMTNTLTSPLDPATGWAWKAISGEPLKFTATWENTTGGLVELPIYYSYLVPGEGNTTEASWTCTGSPENFQGSETDRKLTSDGAPQRVFGSDPDDSDTFVTLAAGQKMTCEITLKTTLKDCTPEGYYEVRTFANRGITDGDQSKVRTEIPSALVQLGCADWILNETFAEPSVSDVGWIALNSACLTRSNTKPAAGTLGKCTTSRGSPSTGFDPGQTGLPAGYLQFTSDNDNQVGAVVYNRPIPSKNGLVAEFTQYQFGRDDSGADGIGFFLAGGASSLTTVGAGGGSLGYANNAEKPGLPNGYLGIGFDVYGNFASTSNDAAPQCGGNGTRIPNSVTLRGPGNGDIGYCAVGPSQDLTEMGLADRGSAYALRYKRAGALTPSNAQLQTALLESQRRTRVTVYPQTGGANPRVTVQMDFGDGYVTVLDEEMTKKLPDTIRFGFLGSTGGTSDAHLLSDVRIGTVKTPDKLDFIKSVDVSGEGSRAYSVGDTVNYQFVVDNNGDAPLEDVAVTDPSISDMDCLPKDLPSGGHMVCAGEYTVTAADRDALYFQNTAEVTAEGGAWAMDSADIAVNPSAEDASEWIGPGEVATFQIMDSDQELGMVIPDDQSRLSLQLVDGNDLKDVVTVAGQGTWTVVRAHPTDESTASVTFTPNPGYEGAVTPMKYRVTSNVVVDGVVGEAEGALSVIISILPNRVCTAEQHRSSDRWWALGDKVELDFGTSGAGLPTAGTFSDISSGNAGTFTVSDSWGNLEFIVDPGQGKIVTKSGGAMKRGGNGTDAVNEIEIPLGVGPSPVTVFPLEQGSGKYGMVTSSATAEAEGELTYRIIDMALNDGDGGLSEEEITVSNSSGAGMAVTSVPSACGKGYWVLNPQRWSANIVAYPFGISGTTGPVTSSLGDPPGTRPITKGYEDIQFSPDLTLMATIASNNNVVTTTNRTWVRLMNFDAQTGIVALTGTSNASRAYGATNRLGYSLAFSEDGKRLYFSSVADPSGSSFAMQRADLTGTPPTLPTLNNVKDVITGQARGGAVRLGPDNRLYWADAVNDSNEAALRYLPNPNETSTGWSTLTLDEETNSNWALSNTLTDCAIPPRKLYVQMLGSKGAPLEGAEFALYPRGEDGEPSTDPVDLGFAPVGGDGEMAISGLNPGTYWLAMTQAPKGYTLLAQNPRVRVDASGKVVLLGSPSTPQATLKNDGQGKFTIEITGTQAATMPFAGGAGGYFVVLGALLFAAIVAAALRRRKAQKASTQPAGRHTA